MRIDMHHGGLAAAFLASLVLLLTTAVAWAGDDPSIKGDLRTNIQAAMDDFVTDQSVGGVVRIYDPVEGRLLKLESYELHSGIVRKGDFYVSCADFADQDGRKIDVDFLVLPDASGKLRATQGIVHSVDGDKRKYHLEK